MGSFLLKKSQKQTGLESMFPSIQEEVNMEIIMKLSMQIMEYKSYAV